MYLLVGIAAILIVVIAVMGRSPVTETDSLVGQGQTFILGYGQWSADNPSTHLIKVLLEEELGYDVEIAELTVPALFAAMASGQVHAFGHAWFPNQEYLIEQYEGQIELIATHYDDSFTALLVPTWLAEEYDLATWNDLKRPEVIALFDRDNDGIGDILGCDVAWTCHGILEEKMEYAGLSDDYVQLALAEQMVNFEIRRAMETREPIIFMNWTPGWMFGAYPVPEQLTILEDTDRWHPGLTEEELEEVDYTGWPPGKAMTAVSHTVKDEHPEAYRLLQQIELPLQAFNVSVNLQIMEGEGSRSDLDRHAHEWIEENRETVDGWLEAAGLR